MALKYLKTGAVMVVVFTVASVLIYPSVCGDNPSFMECRPHIDATIKDLAEKALEAGSVASLTDEGPHGTSMPGASDMPLDHSYGHYYGERRYQESSAPRPYPAPSFGKHEPVHHQHFVSEPDHPHQSYVEDLMYAHPHVHPHQPVYHPVIAEPPVQEARPPQYTPHQAYHYEPHEAYHPPTREPKYPYHSYLEDTEPMYGHSKPEFQRPYHQPPLRKQQPYQPPVSDYEQAYQAHIKQQKTYQPPPTEFHHPPESHPRDRQQMFHHPRAEPERDYQTYMKEPTYTYDEVGSQAKHSFQQQEPQRQVYQATQPEVVKVPPITQDSFPSPSPEMKQSYPSPMQQDPLRPTAKETYYPPPASPPPPPPPPTEPEQARVHSEPHIPKPSVIPAEIRLPESRTQGSQGPQTRPPAVPRPKATGIFNAFVDLIFGLPTQPRDPKWSTPWSTHPEFARKATESKVEKQREPSLWSKMVNKVVDIIFGLPKTPRDPKWAKPWQVHQEGKAAAPVAAPEERKKPGEPGIFSRAVNSAVGLIFGLPTSKRDEKWSRPWQTHDEFKRKEKEQVAAVKTVDHSRGGILNSLVSLVFEVPTGPRDPKWSQPWQTHKEHQKATPPPPSEVPRVKVEPTGGIFNSFVELVFGPPAKQRDPKWATPWTTHKEFARPPPTPEVPQVRKASSLPGASLVNKLVDLVFGLPKDEKRDPKWSKPWQTHDGFKHAEKVEDLLPMASKTPGLPTLERLTPPVVGLDREIPREFPDSKPFGAEVRVEYAHSAGESPLPADSPQHAPFPKAPSFSRPAPEDHAPPVAPSRAEEHSPLPKPAQPEIHQAPLDEPTAAFRPHLPPVPDVPKTAQKPVLEKMEEVPAEATRHEEKPFLEAIKVEEPIVSVPPTLRSRDHIEAILGLDESGQAVSTRTGTVADATLKDLKKICESTVKPLETLYKYQDISNRHLSDAELFGTPLILLLGPYSTGKSTFINYLTGVEFTSKALKTGTPPSHGVFRIIQYGDQSGDIDGTELSAYWSLASLQKFGQNFIDQLHGRSISAPLLKKVTFVEAPGILEMRRPGERTYPFNDVLQWFIDRADLILLMFDYTKLDAGFELEAVLDQLKGREAQTRILLNKADQIPPEELMKIQGSLFWNLSPLLGVNTPPVVYAGSFTSLPYRPYAPVSLFQAQEEALLHDISQAIFSRVDNRIAIARRHAVRVRNHAKMVDTYLTTFYKNKGFLTSKHKLASDIINNPHLYNIYEGMSLLTNISRYDLPDPEIYRDFFRVHNLYDFSTLRETCSFLKGCPLDKIDRTISHDLPELLARYRRLIDVASKSAEVKVGGRSARMAPHPSSRLAAASVHAQS